MSIILRVKVQSLGRTFGLTEYSHLTSVINQCLPTVLFGEEKKKKTNNLHSLHHFVTQKRDYALYA